MGEDKTHVKDFIRVFLGGCLLLVNILAGLVGLALVGVTAWQYIVQDSFPFFFAEQSLLIFVILFSCGSLLFVFSLVGVSASILSLFIHSRAQLLSRVLLILYSLSLLLIYSAGVVAISLQWDRFYAIRSDIGALYLSSLRRNYAQPGYDLLSGATNTIQSSNLCCGYFNGDDYIGSNWLAVQLDSTLRPFSCCASQTTSCSTASSDFSRLGCSAHVNYSLSVFYWSLLAVAVSANFLIFLLLSISTFLISCLIN